MGAGDGDRGKLAQVVRVREFLRYHSRDDGIGNQREIFAVLLEVPHGKDRALRALGFLIRCSRSGQERVHQLATRSG
jgi:hypothetical protein